MDEKVKEVAILAGVVASVEGVEIGCLEYVA